ncbi:MAG: NUDIX domain-containing protein [Anaerolineae bacterium]
MTEDRGPNDWVFVSGHGHAVSGFFSKGREPMIFKENQRINIVVRGLIFKNNHLLVTQWKKGGDAFAIGGRVEFGEPLVEALRREVREETGAEITIKKLVCFGEHVFTNSKRRSTTNFRLVFLVEPNRHIAV